MIGVKSCLQFRSTNMMFVYNGLFTGFGAQTLRDLRKISKISLPRVNARQITLLLGYIRRFADSGQYISD